MSAETLPKYGPVELLVGELGRVESIRFVETPPSSIFVLPSKTKHSYDGKAQWKSEVNRHRRHK